MVGTASPPLWAGFALLWWHTDETLVSTSLSRLGYIALRRLGVPTTTYNPPLQVGKAGMCNVGMPSGRFL